MKRRPITREVLLYRKELLERILADKPDFVEALEMLGCVHTRLGEYEKGLVVDRQLARLSPANPLVYYNLACDYSLLGETGPALEYLSLAVMFGYRDFAHLEKDADLDNLRKTDEYRRFKMEHPVSS